MSQYPIINRIFYMSDDEILELSKNEGFINHILKLNESLRILKLMALRMGKFEFGNSSEYMIELTAHLTRLCSYPFNEKNFIYFFMESPAPKLIYLKESSHNLPDKYIHLIDNMYKDGFETSENITSDILEKYGFSDKVIYYENDIRYREDNKIYKGNCNLDIVYRQEHFDKMIANPDMIYRHIQELLGYTYYNHVMATNLLKKLKDNIPNIEKLTDLYNGNVARKVAMLSSNNTINSTSLLKIIDDNDSITLAEGGWVNTTPLRSFIGRRSESNRAAILYQLEFYSDEELTRKLEYIRNDVSYSKPSIAELVATINTDLMEYVYRRNLHDISTIKVVDINQMIKKSKLSLNISLVRIFYYCKMPLRKLHHSHHANFKLINDPTLRHIIQHCKKKKKELYDITYDELVYLRILHDDFSIDHWYDMIADPLEKILCTL